MKVEIFKKLIKEAVREVLKEELPGLLSENSKPVLPFNVNSTANFTPPKTTTAPTSIDQMLEMTRKSMTRDEFKGIMEGVVQAPGLESMMSGGEQFMEGPQPGIDITQLDFVKKAAAVYNAAVEKDQNRFG